MCIVRWSLVRGAPSVRRTFATLSAIGLVGLVAALGCSDSPPASSASSAPLALSSANEGASSSAKSERPITAESIYEAEEFWPNIVAVADGWQPQSTERARPKTLQGALIRVERDGTARIDLAQFGRVDVPVAQTDLVERANAVRRGEVFKHRGNLAMQLSPLLVRSDLERPGPNPSRGIKGAERILCVFADPRAETFPEIAAGFMAWVEGRNVPAIFVAQNVGRDDLSYIHGRLREVGWTAPFVYPERAATQTERLLREAPRVPWIQLLTREGRELESMRFGGEDSFTALERALVVKTES